MARRALLVLLTGTGAIIAGCSDDLDPVSLPPPESVASFATIHGESSTFRYRTEIHLSGRIGAPPGDGAARTISFTETHQLTDGPSEIVLVLDRPNPLFPGEQRVVDIAEARFDPRSGMTEFRDRSGAVLTVPDRPLDFVVQAGHDIMVPSYGDWRSSQSRSAPPPDTRQSGTPTDPAKWAQAQADRQRVTPEAAARTLDQLRSQYAEEAGPGSTRLFRHARGDTEMALTFDPAWGAVTRTEIRENGRLVASTHMTYETVDDAAQLRETVTQTYDADGRPRARMVRHRQPLSAN